MATTETQTPPVKLIYVGHHHSVHCDGQVHYTHGWEMGKGYHSKPQCLCFCNDPEYLANGFTPVIWKNYLENSPFPG